MKKFTIITGLILILCILLSISGCTNYDFASEDTIIISAEKASELLKEGAILVDTQAASKYSEEHIEGAINVSRNSLLVNSPYTGAIADKETVDTVLSNAGITNKDTLLIYDNSNNMDSSRVWWTLKTYGHDNAYVISGGLNALKSEGNKVTAISTQLKQSTYVAKKKDASMIAFLSDIKKQINDPKENIVLIDVRTTEEYNEGTIPTSLHIDYSLNNYQDGTFKSNRDIQIMYLDKDIMPDTEIIVYCKSSVRAANTLVALYNAGYKNVKIYDGAWLQYKDAFLPIQYPQGENILPNGQDAS